MAGHRALRFLGIVVLGGIGIGACLAALVPGVEKIASSSQYSGKVGPQLRKLDEPSILYDAHGSPLDTLGRFDRQPVKLAEVPPVLIHAIIATEDRTFYDNPGVDFGAIARAFLSNIDSGKIEQGGSTITQQLIKNRIFVKPKRDLDRKIREAVLAWRLDDEWSKNHILEEYLNTVYFGQGSYGVKAAASRFFNGEPLDQLDLAQAAMLAGVISNPGDNNPFTNPYGAVQRRSEVLRRMLKQHYITKAQADVANAAPFPTVLPQAELRADDYYADWVRQLLLNPSEHEFDVLGTTRAARESSLFLGGLRVDTAYDPRLELLARATVNNTLPPNIPFTAAMAVMDPTNGDVKAIVAGVGLDKQTCNLATNPPGCSFGRQPGSTFKAITLTTAIENGYSPLDSIDGTSPCTLHPKGVRTDPLHPLRTQNAEGGGGVMKIKDATRNSVNCAFFRLGAAVGMDKVIAMAHRLGIPESRVLSDVPVAAIGSASGVSPVEMATVYSTLANDGVRHNPIFIRKISDSSGTVLYEADTKGEQVITPQVARTVTDVLTGVVNGTGKLARLPDRTIAGKTGTTDEKKDAWFVGYTPQLVTAVWMGDPGNPADPNHRILPMTRVGRFSPVFGGTYPAVIWQSFMTQALAGRPVLDFAKPDQTLWPRSTYVDEYGRRTGFRSSSGSGSGFGSGSSGTTRGFGSPPNTSATTLPLETTTTTGAAPPPP